MRAMRFGVVATLVLFLTSSLGPSSQAALIFGTNERDVLIGTDGADRFNAKGGKDDVDGGLGFDVIFLGSGRDIGRTGPAGRTIVDDDGKRKDQLFGGDAADQLISADGKRDKISCGAGSDLVIVDSKDKVADDCETVATDPGPVASLTLIPGTNKAETLTGGAGSDFMFGKGGNDSLSGGDGHDALLGGSGRNVLAGEGEGDELIDDNGTSGDVLNGGEGPDLLTSADGAGDTLDCGEGSDTVYADTDDSVAANCETVNISAS
jgi:Ca2+-binding RTX toxin-like protein